MRQIPILCCLLLTVSAGPNDRKTTLDDIERDYVTNQKKPKPTTPALPKVASPALSPTLFGFVPIKTAADYVQQEPKQNYIQPQYVQQDSKQNYIQPQYVQQESKQNYLRPQYVQQYSQPDFSQYTTPQQQYISSVPQKYTTSLRQYTAPQYTRTQQKYVTQSLPQVSAQQSFRYVPQVQQNQGQSQYYDNVQYITDNSIGQAAQQYYTPQYVYLQQYQSPSTSVQTVVDPKGGIQYVMYVPTYVPTPVADQSQTYENVVYATPDAQSSSPAQRTTDTTQNQYTSQDVEQKEQVQYIQPKSKYANTEYVVRKEPKSLLDSYIPSIVQLQYYNQAQQNSVREQKKVSPTVRGGKEKSSSRPAGPAAAETSLTYRYQPSLYKS